MKRKKRSSRSKHVFSRDMCLIVIGIIIVGLAAILLYNRSHYYPMARTKPTTGMLGGAVAGGLITGLAAGIKWAPLGIVGGGIVGALLVHTFCKKRKHHEDSMGTYEQPSPCHRRIKHCRMQKGYEPIVTEEDQQNPSYYASQTNY